MQPHSAGPELKSTLVVLLVTMVMFVVWHLLVEYPRQQAEYQKQLQKYEQQQEALANGALLPQAEDAASQPLMTPGGKQTTRDELLVNAPRIRIRSDKLHGSINLRGGQFDDITLARYRETVKPDSPEVVVLSPAGNQSSYFAEFGWLSRTGDGIRLPGNDSLWKADRQELSPGNPVTLRWENGQGLTFLRHISMDQDYLFTITQEVLNTGAAPVNIAPYGLLNRVRNGGATQYLILHEGPLGVLEGALTELTYEDLQEESSQRLTSDKGWIGITDKYWLSALVPDQESRFTANFNHYETKGDHRYQVDYLGQMAEVAPGDSRRSTTRLFAGAKEVSVLDHYTEKQGIPLFDRAVDFGYLYFLTKPIFRALNYFYHLLGNFGLAILLLTVLIKAVMFPLANKSYKAINQMKKLQPEIQRLKERYKDDKVKFQQEMMGLYRKEKVNPASGCLPMLVQLPVFFALYKVLFVTIEMRHAPFYGWIRDLSAPDPTNIFTLFGLLEWTPPSLLHIGVLPILMSISMIVQQKLQPTPTDPMQAKVMGWLPYIFLFLFAGFPAGLVLYWVWSNVLSILQQWVITRRHSEEPVSGKKKKQRA